MMVVTSGPRLGDAEAGAVAGVVGAGPSVVLGGLACLVGVGVIALTSEPMRAYRASSRSQAEAR